MTRRTRKLIVTGAAIATVGLAGGGVALAADGEDKPPNEVRLVVNEHDDCPDKGNTGTTDPASEL
ncbi:hypothetical protein [Streptomyces fulvoviolaceus]|uniref:hypothetical protein n=1 Tax=Streptomyces fulvoviolaceus TaxID=285535 RepID=UPI00131C691F|nr:hypothetical protein [Streptomyces fulvoviolaceus]MCT9078093.1 hypothetical protein [Streptomyces fulvoviolaceus]